MTTTIKHLLALADKILSDGPPPNSLEVLHDIREEFAEAADTALKSGSLDEAKKLIDAASLVFPRMALAA